MLGKYRVATQLVGSRVVLSSIELVMELKDIMEFYLYDAFYLPSVLMLRRKLTYPSKI
jgi:hypothetical protein